MTCFETISSPVSKFLFAVNGFEDCLFYGGIYECYWGALVFLLAPIVSFSKFKDPACA